MIPVGNPSFSEYFGGLTFLFQYQHCISVSVTEGSISFTLKMSPEFSPIVQVLAYVILPSEHVIAHKADFTVNKCFLNKVSWFMGQEKHLLS